MQQAKLEYNAKNRLMAAKFHSVIEEMILDEILVRGFFGVGTVKLIVQDGTSQHLEECVERKHRQEVCPDLFLKSSRLGFGASGVIEVGAPTRGLKFPRAESSCP